MYKSQLEDKNSLKFDQDLMLDVDMCAYGVLVLVGWLILVSEANCIKQARREFPSWFLLFPYFRMGKEEETAKKLVVL